MTQEKKRLHNCIVRSSHNKNYVTTTTALPRDKTIPPECRWFIWYCLSFPDDWQISIPFFIKDQGKSKKFIYKMLKLAIEAGYIRRTEYIEDVTDKRGRVCKFRRFFYEVAEFPIFKKSLQCPPVEDPVVEDPLQEDANYILTRTNADLTKRNIKESAQTKAATAAPSADAEVLSSFFLKKIQEIRPTFKQPNAAKWAKAFDDILQKDKRPADEVRKAIEWATNDDFWCKNCLSPEKLRKHFDQICIQMNAVPKPKQVDPAKANKAFVWAVKAKYPESFKAAPFKIEDHGVIHPTFYKQALYSLPQQEFRDIFMAMAGGEYNPREWET
jgi:hypothetical protein